MKRFWIIWSLFKYNHTHLPKSEAERNATCIEKRKRQCGHRGRHWSDATTSHGMAAAAGQAMGSRELADEAQLCCLPLDISPGELVLDVWLPNAKIINICYFKQ